MKIPLKEFQVDAVAELHLRFANTQTFSTSELGAVLLNAPTGSGKTLMMTTLIDELLAGNENEGGGDPELVFVWLTDQPELNKQTYDKMIATSGVLTSNELTIIDAGLDAETLAPGKVYFLNTQKLGSGTSFVKSGDGRAFTLWETLKNTVSHDPSKLVLILDEAHRGSKGRDAAEADTIMQKFLKGSDEIDAVPLVIGISATPDRFVKLCNDTNRPLRRVDVEPARVRESGLLKEYVDLYHPDEEQPSHATMLQEAIGAWKAYCEQWAAYDAGEDEMVPQPVLLVQVEDTKSGSKAYSMTDLPMVVGTLAKNIPHDEGDTSWLAHAFQDDADLVVAGHTVRHLAPSAIDADPKVKVVLFKTSLNTGWDCPRAETMVSFRSAKDETNIAQLVGRMVRSPLARRIDANEHLNTVALYLPYYDRTTVEKVITRLASDASTVPPAEFRKGKEAVSLRRATGLDACFAVLEGLPTYTIPRSRPMKPVPRLAKLAGLLAELGLGGEPVKAYRSKLIQVLIDEHTRLANDPDFKALLDETAVLDIHRRRFDYAATGDEKNDDDVAVRVKIADQNIEDLYAESGRLLGEGLHREYLRTRRKTGETDSQRVKLELHALVSTKGVLEKVATTADALRKEWTDTHKAAIATKDEKHRQTWREIEGAGTQPEQITIEPPESIEGQKAGQAWRKHLYVDVGGGYYEDFKSTWEYKAIEMETARTDVVGWLRNQDRKPWSLCVKRRDGTKWVGIHPDFIIFRQTPGGVIADIIDPHLLSESNAPARSAALAEYAKDHSDRFGRIELVIFANQHDLTGKRLDLMDELTRNNVAGVTTHEHLRQLFESA